MGRYMGFLISAELLGVPLDADVTVIQIHRNIQKFHGKVNSMLFDFEDKDIPSNVKWKPIDTYCLDLYGWH